MIRKIVIVIFLGIIGTTLWMVSFIIHKYSSNKEFYLAQNELEKVYKLSNLDTWDITIPTAIIFFNSECEYCHSQLNDISKNIKLFTDFHLLLISYEPESEAIEFLEKRNLQMHYVHITPERLFNTFSKEIPQTLLYREGFLIKNIKGWVSSKTILDELKNGSN